MPCLGCVFLHAAANLQKFVDDFFAGALTPFRRSTAVPSASEQRDFSSAGALRVVGDSFEVVILDSSKDALLEICCPNPKYQRGAEPTEADETQCAGSKNLHATAAQLLPGSPRLVVGIIDARFNDLPHEFDCVPLSPPVAPPGSNEELSPDGGNPIPAIQQQQAAVESDASSPTFSQVMFVPARVGAFPIRFEELGAPKVSHLVKFVQEHARHSVVRSKKADKLKDVKKFTEAKPSTATASATSDESAHLQSEL